MNLGADAWRTHLEGRIADMIDGSEWMRTSSTSSAATSTAPPATCTRARGGSSMNLRAKYPKVACVGEMPYDALHGFIPMYHAGGGRGGEVLAHSSQHLSAPAPGRGSSGVHEWGFGRFNTRRSACRRTRSRRCRSWTTRSRSIAIRWPRSSPARSARASDMHRRHSARGIDAEPASLPGN